MPGAFQRGQEIPESPKNMVGHLWGVERLVGGNCFGGTLWLLAGSTRVRALEQSQIIPMWKLQKKP